MRVGQPRGQSPWQFDLATSKRWRRKPLPATPRSSTSSPGWSLPRHSTPASATSRSATPGNAAARAGPRQSARTRSHWNKDWFAYKTSELEPTGLPGRLRSGRSWGWPLHRKTFALTNGDLCRHRSRLPAPPRCRRRGRSSPCRPGSATSPGRWPQTSFRRKVDLTSAGFSTLDLAAIEAAIWAANPRRHRQHAPQSNRPDR